MVPKRDQRPGKDMDHAVAELKKMVTKRYPDATFQVTADPEEPEAVDLIVTVDVEDIDEVLDLVIDRLVELQIEEGIPLHVLPVQPLERVLEELRRPKPPPQLDIELISPLT